MDLLNAFLNEIATESVNGGVMPYCHECKKNIGRIDWPNHHFSEHMSEAERELVRRELKRLRRPIKPMADEDWDKLTRGE